MDWFFLGLVILGSVWGWTKESKEVFGQHAIQEVTKERFGRLVIVFGWGGLLWCAAEVSKRTRSFFGYPSFVSYL